MSQDSFSSLAAASSSATSTAVTGTLRAVWEWLKKHPEKAKEYGKKLAELAYSVTSGQGDDDEMSALNASPPPPINTLVAPPPAVSVAALPFGITISVVILPAPPSTPTPFGETGGILALLPAPEPPLIRHREVGIAPPNP